MSQCERDGVLRVPGLRFLYSRRRVANVDTGMHVAYANTQLAYVNWKLVSRVWLKGCKVERDDVFRPAMCLLGDDSEMKETHTSPAPPRAFVS